MQHSARPLFRAVQVLFLSLTTANQDIYSYQAIKELANPSTFLIQEWSIYVNINLNLIVFSEVKIARNYIWLPISSCAVDKNLNPESLKFLTMTYFNNQNSSK